VAALDQLAARGIDSCRAGNIELLRQATFGATPVKELSIVAADGRVLCTDIGHQPEARKVVSSEPLADGSAILLEMVQLAGNGQRWIRVRRPGPGYANGVAALIPSELFIPQVSTRGGPISFQVRVVTRLGALVAEAGAVTSSTDGESPMIATLKSTRYALKSTTSALPAQLAANQSDLRALGTVASGLLAIFILTIAILLPRRERNNPIADIERALAAGEFVPADRRYQIGPVARSRGSDALAKAGRQHRAADHVHPARRVERTDHRIDPGDHAPRLQGGRSGARAAAAHQDRLQSDGTPFRKRGSGRGRAQDLQEVADPPVSARAGGD
jgi:hypothetical protein